MLQISQSGSVDAIRIVEMSAGLALAQKTLTDTLYKEGEPQKLITERAGFSQYAESKHIQDQVTRKKNVGGKGAQARRQLWKDCQAKSIL